MNIKALLATPFLWLHPNAISIIGVLVSIPGWYFYSQGEPLLGCLFLLGAVFDMIDGEVARRTGKTSKFGGIFDATLDRVYDGILYLSIAAGELIPWELAMLAYILSITISYIKAKAEAVTGESYVGRNQFSVGIAGRGERIGLIVAGSLLHGLIETQSFNILLITFVVLCVAATITIFWRGWNIYRILQQQPKA